MRKSQLRFLSDLGTVDSETFAGVCRNGNPRLLIRHRKMPLNDLIYSMINRKGLTLFMELRNYMKITHPEEQISKPGYLKQRMKLNPEAFKYLYRQHNREFYSDSETVKTMFKGHLVLAADGSDINVPTTPETLAVYGDASKKGNKPRAQIGLACLYDVLNRMILESDCNTVKFNEMKAAEKQIAKLCDTIGENQPFIVIMDRGYPSTPAILRMMDSEIHFVMRLKSSDYKAEQSKLASDDEDVSITLDKTRRRHYIGTEDEDVMFRRDAFALRIVRVRLDEDNCEVLATNLPRDVFPKECFSDLYHMRWGIETAYGRLKDRLQMENFTGTKPVLLEQDIYSTIYVSNLAEDIIRDVEEEQGTHLQSKYKHKMAINRSLSIGVLKNDLIYVIMEKDTVRKNALFSAIYEEISKNIVPIRPNRAYNRTKGQLASNYSNTHKRCF